MNEVEEDPFLVDTKKEKPPPKEIMPLTEKDRILYTQIYYKYFEQDTTANEMMKQ